MRADTASLGRGSRLMEGEMLKAKYDEKRVLELARVAGDSRGDGWRTDLVIDLCERLIFAGEELALTRSVVERAAAVEERRGCACVELQESRRPQCCICALRKALAALMEWRAASKAAAS